MNIYIVSSGRPNKQITFRQFLPETKFPVITVVPEKDTEGYVHFQEGGYFLFHDKHGIKDTRQFILDQNPSGKIVMLDDDLTFYTRNPIGSFRKAVPANVEVLFEEIERTLDYYTHVSIIDKFMSNMKSRDRIYNGRYFQVLGYNLHNFPHPRPRFRVEVQEDIDMNLQLLSQGHYSCVLTEWAKSSRAYAVGGCSEWRTPSVELEALQKMCELWPGICSFRESKTTLSKKYLAVNWRKAYVPNPYLHSF